MDFTQTRIPDVFLVQPQVFKDTRGYFMESFRKDLFSEFIQEIDFIQDNESKSQYGVLRGLHYQLPPYAQSKLVRAVTGRILDVAVDIRRASTTFGQYVAVELSGENKKQIFLPRGFAHGFLTLSEEATILYKVDAPHAPDHERGIYYGDSDIAVNWSLPLSEIHVSYKDKNAPYFHESDLFSE